MRAGSPGRRAVFLDRDGTLIREADYLADPDGVVLLPGVPGALRRLREAGWSLAVVTNQSGIARGLYSEEDYRRVADRVEAALADAGVVLDAVLHCPHHPDFTGPCGCRKPSPGMLLAAADALGVDLARSVMVGDKRADVEAGLAAGCRAFLVRTGYGREEERRGGLPPGTPVVDSLAEAAAAILAPAGRVDPSGAGG